MSKICIQKLGIAVSTYTEDDTHPYRYSIVEKSLESLAKTIKHKPDFLTIIPIIIVDGPVPQKHLTLLQKFSDSFEIVLRKENGGVSKVKNTGIKVLLDKNVDVGILVDDDVMFHGNWIDVYMKYIEDFQLHHHAWNDKRIFENLKLQKSNSGALKSFSYINKKGYELFKHSGSCGIFLTFTPKLIQKIGYFKIMPGKIGNEHQHFTYRANRAGLIGHPMDLVNSYDYIEHIGILDVNLDIAEQTVIHSVSDDFRNKENKNIGLNNTDVDQYFPCIE